LSELLISKPKNRELGTLIFESPTTLKNNAKLVLSLGFVEILLNHLVKYGNKPFKDIHKQPSKL